jgi:hypothetical protein
MLDKQLNILLAVIGVISMVGSTAMSSEMWNEEGAKKKAGELLVTNREAEEAAILLISNTNGVAQRPNGMYHAIRYLGGIRSRKAVPALCEVLLYEQRVVTYRESVEPGLTLPAFKALTDIGTPAAHELVRKVAQEPTSARYREAAMHVIVMISGVKGAKTLLERTYIMGDKHYSSDSNPQLNTFLKEFLKRYHSSLSRLKSAAP